MKNLFLLLFILLSSSTLFAQEAKKTEEVNLEDLAKNIAGKDGSSFEKTKKLVKWMNTNFNWTYTDYQKRTVQEIIQRRGGNCAELANVLFALLQASKIQARWVAEINLQPQSQERQKDSEALVKKSGNRLSVFGFMHNDHRWLEVYDEKSQGWFPADPATGVVGTKEWILARLGFANRPTSPVAEIAETSKDMIAPFVVLAMESRAGKPKEDRSAHYLLEAFNQTYGNQLTRLPSWSAWVKQINLLAPIAAQAFRGEVNLHENQKLIEELAKVYERLRQEAITKKILPISNQLRIR
jgi:hypothetical protein